MFAGNAPPIILEEGIESSANVAVNVPLTLALPVTFSPFCALMIPFANTLSLNVASSPTYSLLLNDASPPEIIFCANLTSLFNVFAGNAPPIILEEGIESSANVAVNVPLTLALPVTFSPFCALMIPFANTLSLNIASSPTYSLLLNDASPPVIILCANVTSLFNVFAGNTPPIILEEGILLSANVAVNVPLTIALPETSSPFCALIIPFDVIRPLNVELLATVSLLRFALFSIVIFPLTDKSSVTIVE